MKGKTKAKIVNYKVESKIKKR